MSGNFFPFGQNVRAYEDRQIGPRPPLSDLLVQASGVNKNVNSLMRLIDSTPLGPMAGFTYVYATQGGDLYVGSALVGSAFSGKRLSFVPYRPDQSVQPWVYIADSNQMKKVNSQGLFYKDGIEEPQDPAVAIVSGTEQFEVVGDFNSVGAWAPFGTGAAPAGSPAPINLTVLQVLYDSGSTGQCLAVLNLGTGQTVVNVEAFANNLLTRPAFIEQYRVAPSNVAVGSITYDSGPTGPCTIVTGSLPATIAAGEVYQIGGTEWVRIQSVVTAPTTATIRVTTVFHHFAGEGLVGYPSLRVDCPTGGSFTSLVVNYVNQFIGTGVGGMEEIIPINTAVLSNFLGSRAVQPTDELFFIADVIGQQARITNCIITLNLDPNVIDFATNALQWTILGAAFSNVAISNIGVLVSVLEGALGSGTGRLGTNTQLSLATGVNGIKIQWTVTSSLSANYIGLNLVGDYGPNGAGSNAPVTYRYIWRSGEGAKSNPSPPMRIGVTPNNVSVEVQTEGSTDPQVKFIDIFRDGGTLTADTYIGTVTNPPITFPPTPPPAWIDAQDDLTVANNPQLEFDNFEPFPSIDLPATGMVSVFGNRVVSLSGTPFNVRWAPGNLINIGGTVYTLYNRPQSPVVLTILENAGTQGNVPYQIAQPTLLAQPMPSMWGPTDNTGFFFACGDPLRPGTLYFTKGNNPDSAPDTNQLEATSPSEPLMNGVIINGIAKVYSSERAWWIYPNFANVAATIVGTIGSPFTLIPAIENRGLYARQGLCTDGGGNDFFIAKDGIYISPGGSGSTCVTDEIYSLFPHENSEQQPYILNGSPVNPPDYANPDSMGLSFSEGRLYFDYYDSLLAPWTLVLDLRTMMWAVDDYNPAVLVHAPQIGGGSLGAGSITGTLVGCIDGTVREFTPSGTEAVTAIVQGIFDPQGAEGWQHSKELNIQYQGGPLAVTFTPDQGQIPPNVAVPTSTKQIKSLFTIGANKFKLMQYVIAAGSDWRIWVDGFQVKAGEWARQDGYKPLMPLAVFAKTVTTTTTTVTTS